MQIDELVLEQRAYEQVKALSHHLLEDQATVEVLLNHMTNQFLFRFRVDICTESIDRKVYRVEEEPVYETPRHAYLASLPYRSFRRRFLGYLWGIDPDNVPAKRRIHEVSVDAFIAYPDYKVPKHLGRYFRQQQLDSESYWVSQ